MTEHDMDTMERWEDYSVVILLLLVLYVLGLHVFDALSGELFLPGYARGHPSEEGRTFSRRCLEWRENYRCARRP